MFVNEKLEKIIKEFQDEVALLKKCIGTANEDILKVEAVLRQSNMEIACDFYIDDHDTLVTWEHHIDNPSFCSKFSVSFNTPVGEFSQADLIDAPVYIKCTVYPHLSEILQECLDDVKEKKKSIEKPRD